ncbi:MAG: hypothetical protein R3199_03530 [Gemmatimonadota bacterium]|nr:hypothetical protein [Gemmatimonadota bacterium]
MAWRRAADERTWHRCRNCEEFPEDDARYKEITGEPGDRPGGPEENPVCERCDQLLRAGSCEEA